MAIKKAKANYHNGTDFDTFHYETQTKQVKVLDTNGNITHDLDTELTDIRQTISNVDDKTGDNAQAISDVNVKVGDVTTLETTAKTVVPAINELKSDIGNNAQIISDNTDTISLLQQDLQDHRHDELYLQITGGDLTGQINMVNNKSFAGKSTGGNNINIGKVDASNKVVIGDVTVETVIQASNGALSIFDGTNTYGVFHTGNMGHGSGADADTVDGIEGTQIARVDTNNYFTKDQTIQNGASLGIKASAGSEQAGSIYFRNGDGVQKGRILVGTSGDFSIFAGAINGHTFKADGSLFSTYGHILDATSREVQIRFRQGSSDAGMGFYMNNSSNQLGMYDWDSGTRLMSTNRTTKTVNFDQGLEIQGHRVFIQSGQPSSPSTGDIWFDI